MPTKPTHRVKVHLRCRFCGGMHPLKLVVDLPRGVPKELRAPVDASSGVVRGSGGGCPIDMDRVRTNVVRELRDHMSHWIKLGYVEVTCDL